MNKIVYLRINEKEKLNAVKELCSLLSIGTAQLSMNMLDKRVGVITGDMDESKIKMPLSKKAPVFYNMPDLILFYGLSDRELDAFLEGCKIRGIAPTRYKAIVTPFNRMMTLYELITELEKEDRSIRQGNN